MRKKNWANILCLLLISVLFAEVVSAQSEQTDEAMAVFERLEIPEDQPDDPAKVKIIYFTSASCDECLKVKKAMPELVLDLEDFIYIRKYDIDKSVENLAKLLKYLEKFELKDTAPPVMFIGEKSIVGDKKIIETLTDVLIEAISGKPEPEAEAEIAIEPEMPEDPNIPTEVSEPDTTPTPPVLPDESLNKGEPLPVEDEAQDPNLPAIDEIIQKDIPVDRVEVEDANVPSDDVIVDMNEPEDTEIETTSSDQSPADEPVIDETAREDNSTGVIEGEQSDFSGDDCAIETNEPKDPEIETVSYNQIPADEPEGDSSETSQTQPETSSGSAETIVLEQFKKFNLGAIAVAGLLDGVNPCAFTTIVFFISMLAYLGKSKRQIIIVGTGFTFAIFITYLLLGLGLLGAAKSFFKDQGITERVTLIIAVFTFILAGWSLLDLFKYLKTKDTQSMTLGLPKGIKARIHKVIRVGMGTGGLLTGAISVGVIVALLESVCTGQIYLPVIIFVAKSSTLRLNAIGYLLVYNLMFILPLVVIFVITYYGVSSQSLGGFLGRHIVLAKLTMALLFVGLGLLLLLA